MSRAAVLDAGHPPPRLHEVTTPEGVTLHFSIARAGDRLGAFMIDAVLIIVATLLLVVLAWSATSGLGDNSWLWAFVVLGIFLLQSFYFIWFESRGRGMTPGKKRLGIRIMDVEGGTLSAAAVVVRNVMRIVEIHVPLMVLLAPQQFWSDAPQWAQLIACAWVVIIAGMPLFNRKRMRVGDIVAGTIVVVAPVPQLDRDVGGEAPKQPRAQDSAYTFSREQLDVYGAYELQVLEDLLRDKRAQHSSRDALAAVADKIARKIGWPGRIRHWDARPFLTAFYAALRARLEQRMLFGKRKEDKFSDD